MIKVREPNGTVVEYDATTLKEWLRDHDVHPYVAGRVAETLATTATLDVTVRREELNAFAIRAALNMRFALPRILADISPGDILSGIGAAASVAGEIIKLLGGGYEEKVPGSGCFEKTPGLPFIDVDHTAPSVDVTFSVVGDCNPDALQPSLGDTVKSDDKTTACPTGSTGYCIQVNIATSDYGGWPLGSTTGVRTIDVCTIITGPGGKISQGPCRHIKLNDGQIDQSKTEKGVTLSFNICVPKKFAKDGKADLLINVQDGANNGTAYFKSCPVA